MRKVKATHSLRFRLSAVVAASLLMGMVVSLSVFLFQDYQKTIQTERLRLSSTATAYASATAEATSNKNRRDIQEVLRGMRDLPNMQYISVTLNSGEVLAEMGMGTRLVGRDLSVDEAKGLDFLKADNLSVDAPIRKNGQVIGTLTIQSGISWLREQYIQRFLLLLGVSSIIVALTVMLAQSFIRRLLQPLSSLTAEFANIGLQNDLRQSLVRQRIDGKLNDEVGVLIDTFDKMFERIEDRDTQIRHHRDTLEDTVERRTRELRTAKEYAEEANAAKSDFLATMSHEIRTPMNGMMVMAEMLSAAPLSPKHLRYTEIISRSGKGLLNIINDILDFSKIEAGKLEIENIPFSFDTLVDDVASLFAERAREKDLNLAVFVAPDVPQQIIGDPTRLSQVVTNLVNNALKFTQDGGVTVNVLKVGESSDTVRIRAEVEDTGIGISDDDVDKLFERFTQADQSTTRKFGGTGLGLSICKRLIEVMGGEISASGQEGVGSTFWFELDLVVEAPAKMSSAWTGRRVAVMKTNPVARGAIAKAFTTRGAIVCEWGAPGLDLLIADAQHLETLGDTCKVPRVRLSSLAGESRDISADAQLSAELSIPLRREDLERLGQCLDKGDFSAMQAARQDQMSVSQLPDLSHLKVLAVDDTVVNREVLAEALSGMDISPDLAESGEEALRMIRQKVYDVVFMDCSMPGMDGFEASRHIRQIEQKKGRDPVQIIALTAHVTGREATRWRDAGMDHYMAKPFTIPQLLSVLSGFDAEAHNAPSEQASVANPVESPWPGKDSSDIPLISPETLDMLNMLSRSGGRDVTERIFGLFKTHGPKGFKDVVLSVRDPKQDTAKAIHALKSMCNSAGAMRAADICEDLENNAKSGKMPSKAELTNLANCIKATLTEMKAVSARSKQDQAAA